MERYSKTEAYRNTLALLTALRNPSDQNSKISEIPFFGFGGLKELLLPLNSTATWTKEDLRHESSVRAIHEELKIHFGDQYKEAVVGLKQSLLSSFYTRASAFKKVTIGHTHSWLWDLKSHAFCEGLNF